MWEMYTEDFDFTFSKAAYFLSGVLASELSRRISTSIYNIKLMT